MAASALSSSLSSSPELLILPTAGNGSGSGSGAPVSSVLAMMASFHEVN
jgi:hypothetical protein